jgi:hypothetical protein
MRRFVFLFVLASALSLIATVTGSLGAAGTQLVRGNGTITGCISVSCPNPPVHFSVSARDTATGAQGSYSFHKVLGRVSVQCVYQSGDFAAVGGTIVKTSNPDIKGHDVVVYFSDQEATRPDVDPELNPGESLPPGFPANCPSQPASNGTFYPLLSGSISYGA